MFFITISSVALDGRGKSGALASSLKHGAVTIMLLRHRKAYAWKKEEGEQLIKAWSEREEEPRNASRDRTEEASNSKPFEYFGMVIDVVTRKRKTTRTQIKKQFITEAEKRKEK